MIDMGDDGEVADVGEVGHQMTEARRQKSEGGGNIGTRSHRRNPWRRGGDQDSKLEILSCCILRRTAKGAQSIGRFWAAIENERWTPCPAEDEAALGDRVDEADTVRTSTAIHPLI
jgi:hypothetical protein